MKNSSIWPLNALRSCWVDAHIPPAPTPVCFPQRKTAMSVQYLLCARQKQCLTLHLSALREQSLVITLIWQMKRQRLWEVKWLTWVSMAKNAGTVGSGAHNFLTHQFKPSPLSPFLPPKTQFWVHLVPLTGVHRGKKDPENHTANNGTGLRWAPRLLGWCDGWTKLRLSLLELGWNPPS